MSFSFFDLISSRGGFCICLAVWSCFAVYRSDFNRCSEFLCEMDSKSETIKNWFRLSPVCQNMLLGMLLYQFGSIFQPDPGRRLLHKGFNYTQSGGNGGYPKNFLWPVSRSCFGLSAENSHLSYHDYGPWACGPHRQVWASSDAIILILGLSFFIYFIGRPCWLTFFGPTFWIWACAKDIPLARSRNLIHLGLFSSSVFLKQLYISPSISGEYLFRWILDIIPSNNIFQPTYQSWPHKQSAVEITSISSLFRKPTAQFKYST